MNDPVYTVRELQARIGEALRLVGRGRRITVTSRGRVVAELVPANGVATGAPDRELRVLRRLAAEGRLTLGIGGPVRVPVFKGAGVVRRFLKDRADRLRPRKSRR